MAEEAGGAEAAEVAGVEADLVEATEGVSTETGEAVEAAATSHLVLAPTCMILVVSRHI